MQIEDITGMKIEDMEFHNIIIQIPKNTSELVVIARILDGDKIVKVQGTCDITALFQARKDFLDNVEDGDDYNGIYRLTDQGYEYAEELEREGRI